MIALSRISTICTFVLALLLLQDTCNAQLFKCKKKRRCVPQCISSCQQIRDCCGTVGPTYKQSQIDRSVCCRTSNSYGGNVQHGWVSASVCRSIGGTVVSNGYCGRTNMPLHNPRCSSSQVNQFRCLHGNWHRCIETGYGSNVYEWWDQGTPCN